MRVCMLTGKKPNVANQVSHSNIKTKKRQLPNLQYKRVWNPKQNCWMRLRLSTRAIRTLDKIGIDEFARRTGISL
jgi:large subunit ribosomal protein L28